MSITAVLETHIHNDYVSGGLALARATGATYAIPAGEPVSFAGECRALDDGDTVVAGDLMVTAIATAGHTDHHLAYLGQPAGRRGRGRADRRLHGWLPPRAVHRPDRPPRGEPGGDPRPLAMALGPAVADDASGGHPHPADARLRQLLLRDAGRRQHSARSRRSVTSGPRNPAALLDEDAFVKSLLANLPPIPAYYRYMAPLNRIGPAAIRLEPVRDARPDGLDDAIGGAEWVVDLRRRRAFAAEHRRAPESRAR